MVFQFIISTYLIMSYLLIYYLYVCPLCLVSKRERKWMWDKNNVTLRITQPLVFCVVALCLHSLCIIVPFLCLCPPSFASMPNTVPPATAAAQFPPQRSIHFHAISCCVWIFDSKPNRAEPEIRSSSSPCPRHFEFRTFHLPSAMKTLDPFLSQNLSASTRRWSHAISARLWSPCQQIYRSLARGEGGRGEQRGESEADIFGN